MTDSRLLTAKQVTRLPDGEYEIEEFNVTTVRGRTVSREVRYRVTKIEPGGR